MSAENPSPLGASIAIGSQTFRVHHDCKLIRDRFIEWHRLEALAVVADMLRKKQISADEAATRRAELFESFAAGRFDFGSKNNFDKRYTDAGIKRQMILRIQLAHEKAKDYPHDDLIAAWCDEHIDEVMPIMALADANAPKSAIPAAGPPSAGISSESMAG